MPRAASLEQINANCAGPPRPPFLRRPFVCAISFALSKWCIFLRENVQVHLPRSPSTGTIPFSAAVAAPNAPSLYFDATERAWRCCPISITGCAHLGLPDLRHFGFACRGCPSFFGGGGTNTSRECGRRTTNTHAENQHASRQRRGNNTHADKQFCGCLTLSRLPDIAFRVISCHR